MTQPELIRDLFRAFGERLSHEPELAANVYRPLCNNEWLHRDGGTRFVTTWHGAVEIVAGLRMRGEDGLDYYLGVDRQGGNRTEVREALGRHGWMAVSRQQGWIRRRGSTRPHRKRGGPVVTERSGLETRHRRHAPTRIEARSARLVAVADQQGNGPAVMPEGDVLALVGDLFPIKRFACALRRISADRAIPSRPSKDDKSCMTNNSPHPTAIGSAAHAVIASLAARSNRPLPKEILQLCAQHPLACRGALPHRMMVRARLVAAASSYFVNYPPGADWRFVGAEVRLHGTRVDLIWKTPAGYLIDELKTGGLGGVDDPEIAAQIDREIAAGRTAFGSELLGVRLIHLGAPGGAALIAA